MFTSADNRLFLLLAAVSSFSLCTSIKPEQIHISYGDTTRTMVVTWITKKSTNCSVEYGRNGSKVNSTAKIFVDGGKEKRSMYIHRAALNDLKPNRKYVYRCQCGKELSKKYSFKTHNIESKSASFVMYGDLGLKNPQSLTRLEKEANKGMYDAILHVGDFAYDMHDRNGIVGDEFMNMIEPIAAQVPYMVCPGNHEEAYNFSNYRARFSMPKYEEVESLFYSWNMGPVHFISISTEVYYFINYGIKMLIRQYNWLIKDLEEANLAENRKIRPWIILYGHRPMYCSNNDGDDCSSKSCVLRAGLPLIHWFGVEKLLAEYGVDVAIWAHEHSYERLWPVYDYKVLNGTFSHPYTNPRGPVHVTTGSAGNKERKDPFNKAKPYWTAFRSTDYGYTRMKVYNHTHLYWEQVSDDKKGKVIDKNWLIRDKHVKYSLK